MRRMAFPRANRWVLSEKYSDKGTGLTYDCRRYHGIESRS
jgi:hypothetical protein